MTTARFQWCDLVPERVALSQERWERGRAAVRMRALGLPMAEIGRRLGGVGRDRARTLAVKADRLEAYQTKVGRLVNRSPVEKYMSERPW